MWSSYRQAAKQENDIETLHLLVSTYRYRHALWAFYSLRPESLQPKKDGSRKAEFATPAMQGTINHAQEAISEILAKTHQICD